MSAADRAPHLLILGGTGEAVALARAALVRFPDLIVTTSLAGRTTEPAPVPGRLRIGGFGGAAGLAAFIEAEKIDVVIDATHPFAAQISAQAAEACALARRPRLMLERPRWRRQAEDRWIEVADLAAAARELPRLGPRVWLTIGARELAAFAHLSAHHFLVRLVDRPATPLPLRDCELMLARGPFTLAEERNILERHAIDVLVCKASGGAATEAKLIAARERRLPVVMIARPLPPPGERVATVAAALDWLAARPKREVCS